MHNLWALDSALVNKRLNENHMCAPFLFLTNNPATAIGNVCANLSISQQKIHTMNLLFWLIRDYDAT